MRLLPDPAAGSSGLPLPEHRFWRWLLFGFALLAAVATRWPWLQLRYTSLFGNYPVPPAWHSTTGFTCLCCSLLVLVLALVESETESARRAVRPGSLLLTGLSLLLLLRALFGGPPALGGTSSVWTGWFYAAAAAVTLLFAVCWRRCASLRVDQSSSGPPT